MKKQYVGLVVALCVLTVIAVSSQAVAQELFLDFDTPTTGGDLGAVPWVDFGTGALIYFDGSTVLYNPAGSAVEVTFEKDVDLLSFNGGALYSDFHCEVRDASEVVLDSWDGPGIATYLTFHGPGIRKLIFSDGGGDAGLDNLTIVFGFTDDDEDGMDDGWEVDNGLDPANPDDAADDEEPDGLTNLEEYQYGTNPNEADTDDDTVGDYDEVWYDGNGAYDPYDPETNPTGTDMDATDTDTDGDLIPDGVELGWALDPIDPSDGNQDDDDDGLTNGQEYVFGSEPADPDTDDDGLNDGAEWQHSSDPNDTDTDDDGLNDGEEVNTYGCDPTKEDTDSDGISDYDEVNGSPATNPALMDTDGDTVPDGTELDLGSNPNDKRSLPLDLILPNVLARGSSVTVELTAGGATHFDGGSTTTSVNNVPANTTGIFVSVGATTVISPARVTVPMGVPMDAWLGPYDVVVTDGTWSGALNGGISVGADADGDTCPDAVEDYYDETATFSADATLLPALSVLPYSVFAGDSADVTMNLWTPIDSIVGVTLSPPESLPDGGLTVDSSELISNQQVRIQVSSQEDASLGHWEFDVEGNDGSHHFGVLLIEEGVPMAGIWLGTYTIGASPGGDWNFRINSDRRTFVGAYSEMGSYAGTTAGELVYEGGVPTIVGTVTAGPGSGVAFRGPMIALDHFEGRWWWPGGSYESYDGTWTNTLERLIPALLAPPVVTWLGADSFTIQWVTDVPCDSKVLYGIGVLDQETYDGTYVTAHEITLTSLEPGTEYRFMVSCYDEYHNGPAESAEDSICTLAEVDEDIPVITSGPIVAEKTDITATVEWVTDEDSITEVQYGETVAYGSTATVAGYRRTHALELTGLSPNTLYHYRVVLEDRRGNGPAYSADDTFTTDELSDVDGPVITAGPTVTNATQSMAFIEWQTDEPATSTVEYRIEGAPEYESLTRGTLETSHLMILHGLMPGFTYEYRVLGFDAHDNPSDPSADDTFTTLTEPDNDAPVVTSGPSLSYVSDAIAAITFETNEPSNTRIDYGTTSALGLVYIDATLVIEHRAVLTNLDPGATYYFAITCSDVHGNTYSTFASFGLTPGDALLRADGPLMFETAADPDLDPPVITAGPTAVPSYNSATILWATDEDSDGFVEYGLTAGLGEIEGSLDMTKGHAVFLAGLNSSTGYFFRVRSTDQSGNGPTQSPVDTFTTNAAPDIMPPDITDGPNVVVIDHNSARLIWTTDELADSRVDYGPTESLAHQVSRSARTLEHEIPLTNLNPSISYYARVSSRDAVGNGPTQSETITFRTGAEMTPALEGTLCAVLGAIVLAMGLRATSRTRKRPNE
jgi:hypothetical protein